MDQQQILERSNDFPAENTKSQGLHEATASQRDGSVSTDRTSRYLKVLSRLENLLFLDALPEAALEGFVGAVQKQIDQLSNAEKMIILKLPEARVLELKNLDELPREITDSMESSTQAMEMLKLLKNTQFAGLMLENQDGASAGTYGRNGVPTTGGIVTTAAGTAGRAVSENTISTPMPTNQDAAG